jgi:iron-sulfur cluster assembly protein
MISITPAANEKIRYFLEQRGRGIGIRVGVRTTGCSGLAYVLEYVDDERLVDAPHYDIDGIRVYIDSRHMVYMHGMTMDWQKRGLNEGFEFINPNEKDRCGCGESFRV